MMARARSAAQDAEDKAAGAEAAKAEGEGNGNGEAKEEPKAEWYGPAIDVETLRAEHAAAHPPELMAAQLRPADPDAEIDFGSITPKNEGDEIVDASKHGDAIIYVAKGEDGALYKGVVDAESGKAPEPAPAEAGAEGASEDESD